MTEARTLAERLENHTREVYARWPQFKYDLDKYNFPNMKFKTKAEAKRWIKEFLEMREARKAK